MGMFSISTKYWIMVETGIWQEMLIYSLNEFKQCLRRTVTTTTISLGSQLVCRQIAVFTSLEISMVATSQSVACPIGHCSYAQLLIGVCDFAGDIKFSGLPLLSERDMAYFKPISGPIYPLSYVIGNCTFSILVVAFLLTVLTAAIHANSPPPIDRSDSYPRIMNRVYCPMCHGDFTALMPFVKHIEAAGSRLLTFGIGEL